MLAAVGVHPAAPREPAAVGVVVVPLDLLQLGEHARHAGRVDGDVERLRLRVVGARTPVADAAEVGAEIELDAGHRDHLGPVGHLAGLGVDVENVLVTQVVRGDERAGRPVELPEDAVLAHLEQRFPAAVVDEHALEDVVEVVGLAGHELEVPRQLAGRRIQGQHAVGVQRVAVRLARHPRPRLGLRGRPVGQVGLRVVAAGDPGVGAGAERQRQIAPGIPRPARRGRAMVDVRHTCSPVLGSCAEMKQTSFL